MKRLVLFISLLIPSLAMGAPSISSVAGTVTHGEAIVISGADFGSKSPAAPLLWDDGESSSMESIYTDWEPSNAGTTHNMQRRSGTYRGISDPTQGSTFLVGGHADNRPYDVDTGNSVAVMVAFASSLATTGDVFASYYLALDPSYPTTGDLDTPQFSSNHKTHNLEPPGATTIYDTPLRYVNYVNDQSPQNSATPGYSVNSAVANGNRCSGTPSYCIDRSEMIGGWTHWMEEIDMDATLKAWVMDGTTDTIGTAIVADATIDYPSRGGMTIGGYMCYQDTVTVLADSDFTGPDGNGEYYATLATETGLLNKDKVDEAGFRTLGTIGTLTSTQWAYSTISTRAYIGEDPTGSTYYATNSACGSIGNNFQHGGHNDAFRYLDNIYIDVSLARVMLTNNQSYNDSTIIEPQIPSAWADGQVTASVNVGAIAASTAYLFVFDSGNEKNPIGYEVTINASAQAGTPSGWISPLAPTGLGVDEM